MDDVDQLYDRDAEHLHVEVEDLRQEIERFKKEKDQVRAIVGRIGGVPTFNTLLFNIIFAVVIVGCLGASLVWGGVIQIGMIEIAVTAVSLKIMFLINRQARVNHFQLWILSSLEWRLDQIMKQIKSQGE